MLERDKYMKEKEGKVMEITVKRVNGVPLNIEEMHKIGQINNPSIALGVKKEIFKMTDEADIAGLYQQLNDIVELLSEIKDIDEDDDSFSDFENVIDVLMDQYSNAQNLFEQIKGKSKTQLQYISTSGYVGKDNLIKQILTLRIECKKGMAFLEKLSHPSISQKELKKLHILREELEKISSKIDITIEKNVKMAIKECEAGHYLPSALLSSRLIVSELKKIPGKNEEEKVKYLQDSNKIEGDRKDIEEQLFKATRISRNFLSHNPKIFATPDEALSVLSDCISIVKKIHK